MKISDSAIFPVNIDSAKTMLYNQELLLCPVCKGNYNHPKHPIYLEANDNHEVGWGGRGDCVVIPMVGECGHKWQLCIGFHKGESYIFSYVQDQERDVIIDYDYPFIPQE